MADPDSRPDFDVIVLGSGLGGSILAILLARHGHRVAMIERGRHPRMAIGESLVPTSAMWFAVLGHKHDVPELRTLSHLESITRNVGPTSGIKRGFGYVYHREGQEAVVADESSQFISAIQPVFRESQLYRSDVDHYLVKAAERYGVTYRDQTEVTAIEIDPARVVARLDDGTRLSARFVADATGRQSLLARAFGLREEPCRLRHSSRTIFSHMTGVRPFEEVEPGATNLKTSAGWSEGTLHHVFDGGWFWVIPFDNHPGSRSDLVSVGLTLDAAAHPRDEGIEPGKEFRSIVERFPVVERHLGPAEPARPFVGTDRLQHSSRAAVGDRFLLLHHAYGFIDPLFSRGIWRTLESIDVIMDELLPALDEDSLSAGDLVRIDRAQTTMLDDNDQMVFNAFRAMADYDTWTAWLRVWFADELLTTLPVLAASFRYCAEGDLGVFDRLRGETRPGTAYSFSEELRSLVDRSEMALDDVAAGRATPAETRRRIEGMLAASPHLPPILDWDGPVEFGVDLTPPTLARLLWWGRRHAPAGLRSEAFDFRIRDLMALQVRDAVRPGSIRRDREGNVIPKR